jgi:hypothetical protein
MYRFSSPPLGANLRPRRSGLVPTDTFSSLFGGSVASVKTESRQYCLQNRFKVKRTRFRAFVGIYSSYISRQR